MAEDREVLREVWQGRIPAVFYLDPDDIHTVTHPDPYYLMLPRISYISIVIDKVKKHFSQFVHPDKQGEHDMWLDSAGTPLRWHLPVGVIYDQFNLLNPELGEQALPWNLTLHFGKFPEHEILRCNSREAVESHFMSCIKEADQIKHGGRIVSAMQKKDHNQLWQGLQNDKFDQFWTVNRRLMEPALPSDQQDSTFCCFKHLPIRFYDRDCPLMQKLIRPLVNEVSPESGRSAAVPIEDIPQESNDVREPQGLQQHEQMKNKATKRLATLKDLLEDMLPDRPSHSIHLVTHGITPDLDTPLQWMSEHMSYPDNFLHLCVR